MSGDRRPTYFDNTAEQFYGFAQAVRSGDTIYLSGQTALDDEGTVTGAGDMAAQMRAAYAAIARALSPYGVGPSAVVDEILFVTDARAAATVAREVRGEIYGETFPVASTLIEVKGLALPEMLIEIKCTATI